MNKALVYLLLLLLAAPLGAQTIEDLLDLSLDQLLRVPVTVASKKPESIESAPGIVTVITREEISNFAALNLGQVLNRVVSASFITANVFSDNVVQIRGQSLTPYNNHVLILLDGRPVRDPISGGLNSPVFTAFPLHAVDHIEIIRGPGSVLYGSCAYSGVINIVTVKQDPDAAASLTAVTGAGTRGLFFQEADASLRSGDFSSRLSVRHLTDGGPEYAFTGYESISGKAAFDRETLGIAGRAAYKGWHTSVYYGRFYPYALSGSRNTWTEEPHSSVNQQTFFLDTGYRRQLSSRAEAEVHITYNEHILDQEDDKTMHGQDILLELTAAFRPAEHINVIAGAVIEKDKYFGQALVNNTTSVSSFYLQADLQAAKDLKLTGGLQYNKIQNLRADISPRVAVIWRFSSSAGLKILYSQAFRRAFPLETSFNHPLFKGNLSIRPELIRTLEGQLFYSSAKLQASASAYRSRMRSIISRRWVPDPDSPLGESLQYYNAGTHLFAGVELESKYRLSEHLYLTGSVFIQQNTNGEGIKNAALHPDIMIKAGCIYQKGRFSTGIFNAYFGKPGSVLLLNPQAAVVNPEPEAYHLLSVKIRCNITDDFVLEAAGDNLLDLDIRYPEYTSLGVNSLIPLYSGKVVWASLVYNW